MNNMKNILIDREAKILLLQALRRGYFTKSDMIALSEKFGFEPITIEIIDSRDKVEKTAGR
jgi:PII-like signaling protein